MMGLMIFLLPYADSAHRGRGNSPHDGFSGVIFAKSKTVNPSYMRIVILALLSEAKYGIGNTKFNYASCL